MNPIIDYLTQSELSLAAYANLTAGSPSRPALEDQGRGLAPAQAQSFSEQWRVVEQYPGPAGLSATVFEQVSTGKRFLAVRGTQADDAADIWTDIVDIAILGTPERQGQYAALKAKVTQWQADHILPSTFTVTEQKGSETNSF